MAFEDNRVRLHFISANEEALLMSAPANKGRPDATFLKREME